MSLGKFKYMALKDLSSAGNISSMPRKFFLEETLPNLCLNVQETRLVVSSNETINDHCKTQKL